MKDDMRNQPELEQTLSEIRNEEIDPAVVESAAARVLENLRAHMPLRGCEGFQALIPGYRAGRLSAARALLLEDHTHECVACRRALAGHKIQSMPPRKPPLRFHPWRWAMAAALALTLGLSSWAIVNRLASARSRIVVQAAEGRLFHVLDAGVVPVPAGTELPGGAVIRTAKGSGAVLRLADGSLVEMRERSSLSASAAWRDVTVHLEQGSIIVQAGKRRSGHLYVAARDCRVSVTGTVFSVNSGAAGSRVSVLEGEVRVTQGNAENVLHAGDQFTSTPRLAKVPVRDEVAWSRDFDKHLALLREFATLGNKLEAVHLPGVRYSSRLLGLAPSQTAVYVSIPNLGKALGEAEEILRQRLQESPALREWWEKKVENAGTDASFDAVIGKLRALSEYLGEEVVIAAPTDAQGALRDPIIMAEVRRPGLLEFIRQQVGDVAQSGHLLLTSDLVAISPNGEVLRQLAGAGGFAATPFGARVAEAYRDGAGLLLSVDLERINRHKPEKATGFDDMKYLLVEQKEAAGKTDTRAAVSFAGPRHGVASWLAAPGPIGALEFVSPDANLASAFTIKNPGAIIEELLAANPDARSGLAEAESKLGVSLQDDLIGSLGGEFAFALDGPALPVPSWKAAVEVYDSQRLQSAIARLVEAAGREVSPPGGPAVQMSQQVDGGRTYYALTFPGAKLPLAVNYTYVDGYLLAASTRELLDRSIQYRATGYTLTRSSKFAQLLPQDRHASFSGVVYHNLGPVLGPFVEGLGAVSALTPEQRNSVQSLAADMKPMLIVFYGDEDRVTVATSGNLLGLGLSHLMGIPGTRGFGPPR